ncbi:MAG: radical SAM protein [Ruminococcus sp.]|nr:radical SAM protein [Ruminococcus sp.]
MNDYLKNLERIEFVVTMGCTGRCRHCSEGSHEFGGEHIDGDIAAKSVAEVCMCYDIKSLMTFGGEPLLYPDTVCCIHRAAVYAGIPERELITNGFFSRDSDRIKEVAIKIAESGVNRLLLSVDTFHQETIPIEPVEFFADCIRATGLHMELSPAWLVSAESDNPYNKKTRKLLDSFERKGFVIGSGNVIFPQGNAIKFLGEYFDGSAELKNPYEDDPHDIRALCFEPDGNVLGGNIYNQSIMDIIETYR